MKTHGMRNVALSGDMLRGLLPERIRSRWALYSSVGQALLLTNGKWPLHRREHHSGSDDQGVVSQGGSSN